MEPKTVVDDFFKDIGIKTTDEIIAEPISEKEIKKEEPVKTEEELAGELKNRHIRKLEAKLQQERESAIALNERVKVLSETDRFIKENSGEVDPEILKLFTQDESGKTGAALLQKKLKEYQAEAVEKAYERFTQDQEAESSEQTEAEETIQSHLESLEEEYNIDLTSDSEKAQANRRDFLEVVERLSPKERDGSIKEFADFDASFDIWRSSKKVPIDNARNKEAASRSMIRSGTSSEPTENKVFETNNGFREFEKKVLNKLE